MKNFALFGQIIYEINYILKPHQKRKLVYVLIIIIVSAFMELLGVTAILPFIQAVLNPDGFMKNRYVSSICSWLDIHDSISVLGAVGVGIILIYLIKNAFLIYAKYVQISYSTLLQKEIAIEMLESYMSRPYTFFINTNSSKIKIGCNGSVSAFYAVIEALLSLITELLTVSLIGAYLVHTDFFTAVGALFIMTCVMIGTVLGFKPLVKRAGKVNQKTIFERTKHLAQAIDGIKDILVMERKELFINSFEKAANEARKASLTYEVLLACPDRITEGVCVGGIIGIICIRLIHGDDSMTSFIPKLAIFAMAAFKILPSVGKISNRVSSIVYNRPLQEMVYNNVCEAKRYNAEQSLYVESVQKELKNSNYSELEIDPVKTAEDISKNAFSVKYEDVVWKYPNQQEPVLKQFNLQIRKGESVGFIGPSGAGKTTAADVLLGLLHPQSGKVSIDDKDIYAMPLTWSNIIGYVPQSVYLIDDTIRANIAFGVRNVNDQDVWDALERAQLKGFVEQLPDKIDTIVGERGVKLSGGQRQRIAIARALYIKPLILVMDEATAALDNETENAVMESIEALQGNITLIIIAHRLTTIRKCDRIFEIKEGVATEKCKEEVLSGI